MLLLFFLNDLILEQRMHSNFTSSAFLYLIILFRFTQNFFNTYTKAYSILLILKIQFYKISSTFITLNLRKYIEFIWSEELKNNFNFFPLKMKAIFKVIFHY